MAAGTIYGVRALDTRQSETVVTGGAFAEHVRLAVTEARLPELEKSTDLPHDAQKGLIFALASVDVSREEAEDRPEQYDQLDKREDQTSYEEIDDHQNDRRPHQDVIETVNAIATVHKLRKLHSEFSHFLHLTSAAGDAAGLSFYASIIRQNLNRI